MSTPLQRPSPTELLAVVPLLFAQVGFAISLATLLFTGPLSDQLPRATTAAILGSGLVAALIAARSGLDVVVAGAQDVPVVVLLAVSTPIIVDAGDDAGVTILVLLGVISLAVGLGMLLASRLHLGAVVRYLPMTVIQAFIAGTGWLLFAGGLQVALDGPAPISELVDPSSWLRWVPAMAIGLAIAGLGASERAPGWSVGVTIIAAIVGFHLVVAAGGWLTSVEDGGWLVGPFETGGGGLALITPDELRSVPWSSLTDHVGALIAVVGVTVIGVLLNVSAIDLQERARVSIDGELRLVGVTSLLVAPFAGLVGYHLLGDTTLARGMGVRHRTVPVIVGLLVMVGGFWGGQLAGYVPRYVAGGILIALGAGLLVPWLLDLRGGTDRVERLLGVAIVVLMGSVGVLEAIALGIVGACGIFIARYSRIDPVRLAGDGGTVRSTVDRPPEDQRRLDASAEQRLVLELQGYLFFGSMSRFADGLRARLAEAEPPITTVLIDLRHVTGVDDTGLDVLARLAEEQHDAGRSLVWSGIGRLEAAGGAPWPETIAPPEARHDDLDAAVEATERAALVHLDEDAEPVESPDDGEVELSSAVRSHLRAERFDDGTVIMRRGEPSDSLHIVVSGWLQVSVEDQGRRRRLRRFGPGGFLGELGFHTGAPRTADVIADGPVETLALDRVTWERLRTEHPELALELSDRILSATADRLRSLSDRHTRSLR